jgi:hypothetical protein
MRQAAEGAQQVDRVAVRARQALAVAYPRHLRAAGLGPAFGAGNMREIFRLRRIGDVDDRGAVELPLAVERIHGLVDVACAVVADIGDIALALLVNGRLIGAARLQVVEADEAHVLRFRRIAEFLGVGRRCE